MKQEQYIKIKESLDKCKEALLIVGQSIDRDMLPINENKLFLIAFGELNHEVNMFKRHMFDKRIALKELQDMVSLISGISNEKIDSPVRKRKLVVPRQVVMAVYHRTFAEITSHEAGEVYDRDHATVLHACKQINNLIETEKSFKRQYQFVWEWAKKHNKYFTLVGEKRTQ